MFSRAGFAKRVSPAWIPKVNRLTNACLTPILHSFVVRGSPKYANQPVFRPKRTVTTQSAGNAEAEK